MDEPPLISAWQTMLSERLGLNYADHSPVLKKAVRRLCRRFALTSEAALEALGQRDDSDPMWHCVRDEVVVSSSRFFRDPEMYTTIEHWLSTRDHSSPLMAMSFGAADGREAYSLAMLLAKTGFTFQIIGVDLSPKAIADANAAVYMTRDIDEIPISFRGRYTVAVDSDRFTIDKSLCAAVSFVSPDDQRLVHGARFDLICCQNTLMYLTQERQMSNLQWFENLLNPGGLLLLSPTDQPQWRGQCLQRYNNPRVRALQKPLEAAA